MPCPRVYADLIVAERFKLAPWTLKDAPALDYELTLALLGIEGEYRADTYGLDPDEGLYDTDED